MVIGLGCRLGLGYRPGLGLGLHVQGWGGVCVGSVWWVVSWLGGWEVGGCGAGRGAGGAGHAGGRR